jgi:imidazolonepropionase
MANPKLLTHIKGLVQTRAGKSGPLRGSEMKALPVLPDAFLLIENGQIIDFGPMEKAPKGLRNTVNLSGRFVFPSWVDSHTHLVFAAPREGEFKDRIKGLSYEEIARRGGGILNSARKLQETTEDDLFNSAWERLEEVIRFGTGAIEIKSGYGLSVESELKILRVIRRMKEQAPIPIRATFLGAHALPMEYRDDRAAYLRLIVEEMLPRIAEEGLADYLDVFCEKVAFSVEETVMLMKAGQQYGLPAKIHVNQFNAMGGIAAAIQHGALSVDHLEVVSDEDVSALKQASTIATLLPSAPFFLNDQYPPGRRLVDEGVAVALASDYNPGSTPSGRMSFVVSLGCIKSGLTPEEAINAATLNGAHALQLGESYGSIERGKVANVFVTRPMPSITYLPYAFGRDQVDRVMLNGEWWGE